MAITYETTPQGDLKFSADQESREELLDILADPDRGYPRAQDYLVEQVVGNGLEYLRPEAVGALTSAPIFGEDVSWSDSGEVEAAGALFWFPNYAVSDELEVLARTGDVVFPRAPRFEPAPAPRMR